MQLAADTVILFQLSTKSWITLLIALLLLFYMFWYICVLTFTGL